MVIKREERRRMEAALKLRQSHSRFFSAAPAAKASAKFQYGERAPNGWTSAQRAAALQKEGFVQTTKFSSELGIGRAEIPSQGVADNFGGSFYHAENAKRMMELRAQQQQQQQQQQQGAGTAGSAAALSSSLAGIDGGHHGDGMAAFQNLDANGDGTLSRDELAEPQKQANEDPFAGKDMQDHFSSAGVGDVREQLDTIAQGGTRFAEPGQQQDAAAATGEGEALTGQR